MELEKCEKCNGGILVRETPVYGHRKFIIKQISCLNCNGEGWIEVKNTII